MAKTTGLGARFAVGGYDLGGDVQSLSRIGGGPASPQSGTDITLSAQARICSTLAADGVAAGEYEASMEWVNFFNPATDRAHPVLSALPTASTLTTFAAGAAAGAATANLVAKQVNYDPSRGGDGSLSIATTATESDGIPLEWGVALTTWGQSIGVAGNLTGVDLGSVSPGAYGAAFHLQSFTFTGTSVTFKIQDSPDNVTFTDVVGGGFTAVSGVHTWQRIETAAINVARYLRVVSTGTFSAWTGVITAHRRNALKSY
jgi:hypothetical protein